MDAIPDGTVEFLDECSSWWAWLESASPDALDAYARTGRISISLEELGKRDFRRLGEANWSEVIVPDSGPLRGTFKPRAMFEVVVD